jgi:hypothetical protein
MRERKRRLKGDERTLSRFVENKHLSCFVVRGQEKEAEREFGC